MHRLLVADTIDDVSHLAILLRKFPTHTHAGILYRDPDGKSWVLELQGPNSLVRKEWSNHYGWAVPSKIKVEELRLIAQLCDLIWSVHKDTQDIPYGLEYSRDARFNAATGALAIGDKLKGLTCATFVLAVFNAFNIQLLETESWEFREEDEVWQKWVADVFKDGEMAKEIPCLRYRPEEVVGSCISSGHPTHFNDAAQLGRTVLEDMTTYLVRCGQPA